MAAVRVPCGRCPARKSPPGTAASVDVAHGTVPRILRADARSHRPFPRPEDGTGVIAAPAEPSPVRSITAGTGHLAPLRGAHRSCGARCLEKRSRSSAVSMLNGDSVWAAFDRTPAPGNRDISKRRQAGYGRARMPSRSRRGLQSPDGCRVDHCSGTVRHARSRCCSVQSRAPLRPIPCGGRHRRSTPVILNGLQGGPGRPHGLALKSAAAGARPESRDL